MTKEELQNYGHNKTTTTPETTKQEDFRQPPAHARFTHVHSRTRQFGECHHTHNNSHSTTHAPLMTFHRIINEQDETTHMHNSNVKTKQHWQNNELLQQPPNRAKPATPSVCNQEIKTKTSSSHLTTTPVTQHQKKTAARQLHPVTQHQNKTAARQLHPVTQHQNKNRQNTCHQPNG